MTGANGGRFTLRVGTFESVRLDYDATAAKVKTALQRILEQAAGVAVGAFAQALTVTKAGGSWVVSYTGALAGAVGRGLLITSAPRPTTRSPVPPC